MRFRLRLFLYEVDLSGPEVTLGRSPECDITVEDPLVSRHHARLLVEADRVLLENLGSRNGVRVNGERVQGPVVLQHGDRIRVGAQEVVLVEESGNRPQLESVSRVEPGGMPEPGIPNDRAALADGVGRPVTSRFQLCNRCGSAVPDGSLSCPHCGAQRLAQEETVTSMQPQSTWRLKLVGEVLERALQRERWDEMAQVLRMVADDMEERVAAGEVFDSGQVEIVAHYAVRLAIQEHRVDWLRWIASLYDRQQMMLPSRVVQQISSSSLMGMEGVHEVFGNFVRSWRRRSVQSSVRDLNTLQHIERMLHS